MPTAPLSRPDLATAPTLRLPDGLGLLIGLAALLLPTYWRLHETVWNLEVYEHGLIIVVLLWWLVWRAKDKLLSLVPAPAIGAGSLCLAVGLFVYYVGRAQNLPLFEVTAHLPILIAALLLVWGPQALRVMWFPLLFMLFLIPLPGFVMVAMTSSLKQYVSIAAEWLLYNAGYPIARDGVMIRIGQYRMLVADACSGLNSIYSLSALGLLYLNVTHRPGRLRLALLLAAIVPIAFIANIVRVVVLILLTYHFGDEAGQGFLHNLSGVLLFIVGLLVLLVLDAGLQKVPALSSNAASPLRTAPAGGR